ncbi:MAG: hypothetical protein ACYTFA_10205 [Planctomycetota bacterium]|jgi:hypothetical protein
MAKNSKTRRAKVKKPARKKTPKKRTRKPAESHTAAHKEAFLEALSQVGIVKYAAVETLETELYKRAMGIDGRQASDALLRFYLRALKPDKYNRAAMPTPPPPKHIVIRVGKPRADSGPQPDPNQTKVTQVGEPPGTDHPPQDHERAV